MMFGVVKKRASEWTGADWERFEWWLLEQRPPYGLSARRQARSAVNFLFVHVLKMQVGKLDLPVLPKPERALVVVPTREEMEWIFYRLHGQSLLAAQLMHGSGVRVREACRIRVRDLDLNPARPRLRVWDGKGVKNRWTVLPVSLLPALARQMEWWSALHARDLADGNGFVEMPGRQGVKWRNAARELGWQWLLCSSEVKADGKRWHHAPGVVQRDVRMARQAAGMVRHIVPHCFRKAFASELDRARAPLAQISALLGHEDINTTSRHYLETDIAGAFSPADVPSAVLEWRPALQGVGVPLLEGGAR
jgi:integrase